MWWSTAEVGKRIKGRQEWNNERGKAAAEGKKRIEKASKVKKKKKERKGTKREKQKRERSEGKKLTLTRERILAEQKPNFLEITFDKFHSRI